MRWVEIRVHGVDDTSRDAIVAALVEAGAAGVVEPTPQELLTYLPEPTPMEPLAGAIGRASPSAVVEHAPRGEIDWATLWPPRVGTHRVGRIAVAPPWLENEIQDAELPIVIEPATAFGTGEHESTRGVLHLLPQVLRPGELVADLGTGSAILAIAAAKLGAARVVAIEVDPDAIGNAEANVARNGVSDRVTVLEGDAALLLPLVAPVHLILANLISSLVLELAPCMRDGLYPGGHAIVSGILSSERPHVVEGLTRGGWRVESECAEGEWWSGVIARA